MKDYITYLLFDDLSQSALFDSFKKDILGKSRRVVVTPNLDFLRQCYSNPELRKIINTADYSTIDGKPVLKLAKKEKKRNFRFKISGSDMVNDFLPIINENKWSLLIFGGKEGVAEKAKTNIVSQYPNIKFIKTICPTFGFDKDEGLMKKYVEEINSINADVVLLCLSFPKSEKFYFYHQDYLCPSLYLCVGATVDFLAGNIKRAPKWLSKIGFEWFYRMLKDFKRLFPRYWNDGWFLLKIRWLMIFHQSKIIGLRDL